MLVVTCVLSSSTAAKCGHYPRGFLKVLVGKPDDAWMGGPISRSILWRYAVSVVFVNWPSALCVGPPFSLETLRLVNSPP